MLCQPNGNFVALKPDQAALLSITKCLWGLNKTKVQGKKIHPSISSPFQLFVEDPKVLPGQSGKEPTPWTNPVGSAIASKGRHPRAILIRCPEPSEPFNATLWRNLILAACVGDPLTTNQN